MKNDRIIELPVIIDHRGNLSFAEIDNHIPFSVKNVNWFFNFNDDYISSELALDHAEGFLIVLKGKVKAFLKTKHDSNCYILHSPKYGLYLQHMENLELVDISRDALIIVLSSYR